MVSGTYTTWVTCSHYNAGRLTGPNILLSSSISVGRTFLAPGIMNEKISHETSHEMDSCFDLHKVASATPCLRSRF